MLRSYFACVGLSLSLRDIVRWKEAFRALPQQYKVENFLSNLHYKCVCVDCTYMRIYVCVYRDIDRDKTIKLCFSTHFSVVD